MLEQIPDRIVQVWERTVVPLTLFLAARAGKKLPYM
jgi:hypothetical protein